MVNAIQANMMQSRIGASPAGGIRRTQASKIKSVEIKPGAKPLPQPRLKHDVFIRSQPIGHASVSPETGPKAARPSHKVPRFSGQLSTLNASLGRPDDNGFHGSWPLTGKQLKNIVTVDSTPYVGQTPMLLQAHVKMTDGQLFEYLDDLAEELRPEEDIPLVDRILAEFHTPTQNIVANEHPLQLKKVGEGSFGVVYKLTDGDTSYAFKVHKSRDRFDGYSDHSPYQEAATGAYLTAHNIIKDVVRFHAANPEFGWVLSEFITPHSNTHHRDGMTLREAGIAIGDNHYNNTIGNVRVDLGGPVREDNPLFDSSTYLRVGTSW